jgi:hypothetical protein
MLLVVHWCLQALGCVHRCLALGRGGHKHVRSMYCTAVLDFMWLQYPFYYIDSCDWIVARLLGMLHPSAWFR